MVARLFWQELCFHLLMLTEPSGFGHCGYVLSMLIKFTWKRPISIFRLKVRNCAFLAVVVSIVWNLCCVTEVF